MRCTVQDGKLTRRAALALMSEVEQPTEVHRKGKDGSEYTGGWLNGKAHGKGKYKWADGTYYDGDWYHGLSHGWGELNESNGRVYKGHWNHDKQEGEGEITYSDGTTFKGTFKNGMKHGSGTMKTSIGDVYVGDFANDKIHGCGYMVRSSGVKFEGTFAEGYIREGKLISSKFTYEGQFSRKGQQHGKGKLITPGGVIEYDGYFLMGKPCTEEEFDKYEIKNSPETSTPPEKNDVKDENFPNDAEKASVRDRRGNYPIYYAVHENRPKDEILRLMSNAADKEIIGAVDEKTGRTLLHTCCHRGDDIEIIQKLIHLAPNAVKVQDRRGGLPLHSFCFRRKSEKHLDILYELLREYPIAIRMKTYNGNTPLNLACYQHAGDIIPALLAFDKTQIDEPNAKNETPKFFVRGKSGMLSMLQNVDQTVASFESKLRHQGEDAILNLIECARLEIFDDGHLSDAKKILHEALRNGGGQPWMRSKLMMVGEGRSGKTSTLRNLMGLSFRSDECSTIGANTEECIVNQFSVNVNRQSNFEAWKSLNDVNDDTIYSELDSAAALLLKEGLESTKIHGNSSVKSSSSSRQDIDESGYITPRQDMKDINISPEVAINKPNDTRESQTSNGTSTSSVFAQEMIKNYGVMQIQRLLEDSNSDSLKLGIWDYGGQEIFYAIHHLFLTRFGVYLVLFDMTKLIKACDARESAKAIEFLHFWLNSIALYGQLTNDDATKDVNIEDKGSPILLIGSRKDTVSETREHMEISERLNLEFGKHFLDQNIILNNEDNLCFFPVDNTDSKDPVIERIRIKVERAISGESYIKDTYPMPWMKACDILKQKSREMQYLSIDEVCELSSEVGINQRAEVKAMLKHFHELGVVIYYGDRKGLSQLVILNPQWIIDRISDIIREFNVESCIHSKARDQIAMSMSVEWADLTTEGILSKRLLRHLWRGDRPNLNFLLTLMQTFALIVPLKIPVPGSILLEYLVPNLLPRNEKAKQSILNGMNTSTKNTKLKVIKILFKKFVPNGIFGRFSVVILEYIFLKELEARQKYYTSEGSDDMTASDRPKLSLSGTREIGVELYRTWGVFVIHGTKFMVTREKFGFHIHVQEWEDTDKDRDINSLCRILSGLLNLLNTEFYNARLDIHIKKPHDTTSNSVKSTDFSWSRPTPETLTPKACSVPAYLRQKASDQGYYTVPDLLNGQSKGFSSSVDLKFQLSNIKNFVVGRKGYGKIEWLVPLDLSEAGAIDDIIYIQNGDVSLYEFHEFEPAAGKQFNNPARITFENVYPHHLRSTQKNLLGRSENAKIMERFKRRIEKIAKKRNYKNNTYDETKGIWQFEVEHFSHHGYHGDDDDLVAWLKESLWSSERKRERNKELAKDYAGGLIYNDYFLEDVLGADPPSESVLVNAGIRSLHVKKIIRILYEKNPKRKDYEKLIGHYDSGGDVIATINNHKSIQPGPAPSVMSENTQVNANTMSSNQKQDIAEPCTGNVLKGTNKNSSIDATPAHITEDSCTFKEKQSSTNDESTKKMVSNPLKIVPEDAKRTVELSAYDVFLSHDWGKFKCEDMKTDVDNHKRVARINKALQQHGLVTWFDEDRMSGTLIDAMSRGIEKSTCVLCFITANYILKVSGNGPNGAADNCKKEFGYACVKKTSPHNMLIPILMDSSQRDTKKWTGGVGISLAGDLYLDMSSAKLWDTTDPSSVESFKKTISTLVTDFIEKKAALANKTLVQAKTVAGSGLNAVRGKST